MQAIIGAFLFSCELRDLDIYLPTFQSGDSEHVYALSLFSNFVTPDEKQIISGIPSKSLRSLILQANRADKLAAIAGFLPIFSPSNHKKISATDLSGGFFEIACLYARGLSPPVFGLSAACSQSLAAEYRLRTAQCLITADYTKAVENTVETMMLYIFGEFSTK